LPTPSCSEIEPLVANPKTKRDLGVNFFWGLGGIPLPESSEPFEYYIIPSSEMALNVKAAQEKWLATPAKNGETHKDSKVRTVSLPPFTSYTGWDISQYLNRWDLIEACLGADDTKLSQKTT
jgi:hypothetical protein